jgi:hypothetical protein
MNAAFRVLAPILVQKKTHFQTAGQKHKEGNAPKALNRARIIPLPQTIRGVQDLLLIPSSTPAAGATLIPKYTEPSCLIYTTNDP